MQDRGVSVSWAQGVLTGSCSPHLHPVPPPLPLTLARKMADSWKVNELSLEGRSLWKTTAPFPREASPLLLCSAADMWACSECASMVTSEQQQGPRAHVSAPIIHHLRSL